VPEASAQEVATDAPACSADVAAWYESVEEEHLGFVVVKAVELIDYAAFPGRSWEARDAVEHTLRLRLHLKFGELRVNELIEQGAIQDSTDVVAIKELPILGISDLGSKDDENYYVSAVGISKQDWQWQIELWVEYLKKKGGGSQ
jgi:hypothetical protein